MIDKNKLYDPSLILLLASNLITILLAIIKNWDIGTILLIFWTQGIIIGLINVVRLLSLKNQSSKYIFAPFFAFHYGFFHLVYFIFLKELYGINLGTFVLIAIPSITFLVNHIFSYAYNREEENETDMGKIMFKPYLRIIPIHLTLIFGGLFAKTQFALVFFLVIKTIIDLIAHMKINYRK